MQNVFLGAWHRVMIGARWPKLALAARSRATVLRRLAGVSALSLSALASGGMVDVGTASAAVPALRATYSTIDYPGAAETDVNGIARIGPLHRKIAIVGAYTDIRGAHGFVLTGGVYTTLDVPVPYAKDTSALGINASGEIVGDYYDSLFGATCSFLYYAGTYNHLYSGCSNDLDPYFEAHGINSQSEVVGDRFGNGTVRTGFLDTGQHGLPEIGFDLPSSKVTSIWGINSNSTPELVGYYQDTSGGYHGAVWKANRPYAGTSFDVPGTSRTTNAIGVNDSGQIVGSFVGSPANNDGYQDHGFLDSNGIFSRVDYPGADQTQANGIDDAESNAPAGTTYDIVGTYRGPAPQLRAHGFIATVTPTQTNIPAGARAQHR